MHKHTTQKIECATDNSELKYCMHGLLLGSMNIHIILEQSQKHRCQNADIRQVPLDYYCQLNSCCVL